MRNLSKITRLITLGIDDKNIIKKFNNFFKECEINFLINQDLNDNGAENENIKLLFRTEAMNDLNFITQYDPINKETSCILSMLYCQNDIKIPSSKIPDINKKMNYY